MEEIARTIIVDGGHGNQVRFFGSGHGKRTTASG
jgi:hypothetical protein